MEGLLLTLLIGAAAGWLAGRLMRAPQGSWIVTIIVGIIGGLLGGWLVGVLGLPIPGPLGSFLVATGGACLLILLLRYMRV